MKPSFPLSRRGIQHFIVHLLCSAHDSRLSACGSCSCFFKLLSSSTRLCTARLRQSASGSPSATSVNTKKFNRCVDEQITSRTLCVVQDILVPLLFPRNVQPSCAWGVLYLFVCSWGDIPDTITLCRCKSIYEKHG